MSIRQIRYNQNVLAEQTDQNRSADRLFAELTNLVGRVEGYYTFQMQQYLDNTGVFDAQEVEAFQLKMLQMIAGGNALMGKLQSIADINGADDTETAANLNAYLTDNNTVDVAAYGQQFE